MILRMALLAVLVVVSAGLGPLRYPTFQLTQNADDRGKTANAVDPAERGLRAGRYNLDKRNYIGAVNRFKSVLTEYPTSPYVEEALARISETYLALGIAREAQCAVAVLQRKFPDSSWSHHALDVLKSAGLEQAEDQKSCISQAFERQP